MSYNHRLDISEERICDLGSRRQYEERQGNIQSWEELGRNESQQISGKMCKGKSAKKKLEMISWNIYTNLQIQEAQEVLNEKDMCTL